MSAPLVFQQEVQAPVTRLSRAQMWTALLDKIKHPEKYVGSRDVKIVGETADYVDREMTVGPPDHPMVIKERITWSEAEGTVTFTEHNNAEKTGHVENHLEAGEDGQLRLRYVFDWHWNEKADRAAVEKQVAVFKGLGNKPVVDTIRAAEEANGIKQ